MYCMEKNVLLSSMIISPKSLQVFEISIVSIILQMKKLKVKFCKTLVQDYTVRKRQSQNRSPDLPYSKVLLFA